MPGPLAAQVAMWVGYSAWAPLGALGTAVAFILYGVSPAVIAIIVLAAARLAG